ncbi:ketoacyl-ACP synthase III [Cohnella suwonensis]|uniref:Beta-ketoacyl-[acyl-carrier-protein] synthase III n=1 Tax=Cohnella suwonensis TaxID=696072 RepID=A0ABW0LVX7_9BACL
MSTATVNDRKDAFVSNARIAAIGSYVPEATITNVDLERLVDTNDEWIVRRTGIEVRHRAAEDQTTSDLAVAAVRNLLARFPLVLAEEIDAILVATTTPERPFPSVASQVQTAIGAKHAFALDVSAACAGFVSALQLANGLLLSGAYRKALVIGAETLTRITDYADRSTCILFGDGAGAVLLEAAAEGSLLAANADTDGSGGLHVYCDPGAKIVQNGREVYKWALTVVPEGVKDLLERAGLPLEQLDWFVPHSANLRMIEAICERLGLPMDKALQSVALNGNTSAASIPLALDAAYREGKLAAGQLMALYGFGSGLTRSGLLLRWTI